MQATAATCDAAVAAAAAAQYRLVLQEPDPDVPVTRQLHHHRLVQRVAAGGAAGGRRQVPRGHAVCDGRRGASNSFFFRLFALSAVLCHKDTLHCQGPSPTCHFWPQQNSCLYEVQNVLVMLLENF